MSKEESSMIYHEAAESPVSRITEIPEDMRRKIAARYLNLVRDTAQKEEDDTQARLCLATQRVLQAADNTLRSAETQG